MKTLLLAAGFTLLASPSFALYCAIPPTPGITFKLQFGDTLSESEENALYLKLLRHRGVDATGVRQWNNCLRAFVRDDDGHGEHLEYYDPTTFERVQ
ncbi:MAG: hypothetical protein ABL879_04160 [Devosia sp.]